MISKTANSIYFVLQRATQKKQLFFWLFIRLISATLPLVTIYQFSHVIKLLEANTNFKIVFTYLVLIFIVRILDNFLRIRSITKLDYLISNLSFDIHNYFLTNFNPESKLERHGSIQAIRNFADSTIRSLTLFVQPGIDSLVSILFIPIALFFIDFRAFILMIVYLSVYLFVNKFTNQRYQQLRDFQNTKTESYYGKFQESDDVDLEQQTYSRHYRRLTNWSFLEWFTLQNTAVFFFLIFLFYQVYLVTNGNNHVSDLVLIMGYTAQTQTFLNSFTDIWHNIGDMYISLKHLAKNNSIAIISLQDLI